MKNLVLTLGSIWSWFVLAVCVVVWLPLMAIVWLVTSPDAPRLLHKRIYLPAITQKYGLLPGWDGPGTAFAG